MEASPGIDGGGGHLHNEGLVGSTEAASGRWRWGNTAGRVRLLGEAAALSAADHGANLASNLFRRGRLGHEQITLSAKSSTTRTSGTFARLDANPTDGARFAAPTRLV
jgi:hypothetical protein